MVLSERDRRRFFSKIDAKTGCWIWIGVVGDDGYGVISIGSARDRKHRAHRLMYELCFGSNPGELAVMHSCDNPLCVNPCHLTLGTLADNNADCVQKGRNSRGNMLPHAKLTPEAVVFIKSNPAFSERDLALRFGVSRGAISMVRSNRSWRHIVVDKALGRIGDGSHKEGGAP